MTEIRALVTAAGRGTRAGLEYPKTLFPIQGIPILVRIAGLLRPYDACPSVIVSPEGELPIRQCLDAAALTAHLVVQPAPKGMGNAVQRFVHSPAFSDAENVLLVWGDIPFIQLATLEAMINTHLKEGNDFTFVTRRVDSAYTIVSRDSAGVVTGVVESRELGIDQPKPGERDIGLFIFRKGLVMDALLEELPGKWGKSTGEHGFLYIIGHLAARGFRVMALPIATELDIVSLNSMKDIDAYL